MANYQILYRISVDHNYFNRTVCTAMKCYPGKQGALLMRRRGLLFQADANEWKLIYDSTGGGVDTKHDVVELELHITDPIFMQYTEWKDLNLMTAYHLELPATEETIDATSAILSSDRRRNMGIPFCTIRLKLTEQILASARAGCPQQTVLRFQAPAVQWEYILFPRTENNNDFSKLSLEEATGQLQFSTFIECTAYDKQGFRSLSKQSIPMRESYPYSLRVVEYRKDSQKRILLSTVNLPEPERYPSNGSQIIRHITYI